MVLRNCQPYEWYFVVTCQNCKTKQPIFHDASRGKATLRRTYDHQCDECKSVSFYDPDEIEHYQHKVERRKQARS